jgi:hypothetical protein
MTASWIERMMTSRKVEVEVTCDNTAKLFLHIPHPTLSAIRLVIVREGGAYSIRPSTTLSSV